MLPFSNMQLKENHSLSWSTTDEHYTHFFHQHWNRISMALRIHTITTCLRFTFNKSMCKTVNPSSWSYSFWRKKKKRKVTSLITRSPPFLYHQIFTPVLQIGFQQWHWVKLIVDYYLFFTKVNISFSTLECSLRRS